MAQVWAVEHFRPFTAYPARPKRWETFTEAAHRRNQQIVDESDSLIAFPCQHSKGTWDTIRRAKKKGIPVEVIIIGKSPRGDFDHCVVGRAGVIVHDPREGAEAPHLLTIKTYGLFIPANPAHVQELVEAKKDQWLREHHNERITMS